MQTLLTPEEFASRAVGVPWLRWGADWSGMDCFGCIALYFREVLGVVIDAPRDEGGDHGFTEWREWQAQWAECAPEAGATCFMAWREGKPQHCGVLLPGAMLLHAEANEVHPPGSVRATRLEAAARVYGPIRFYRYAPC